MEEIEDERVTVCDVVLLEPNPYKNIKTKIILGANKANVMVCVHKLSFELLVLT